MVVITHSPTTESLVQMINQCAAQLQGKAAEIDLSALAQTDKGRTNSLLVALLLALKRQFPTLVVRHPPASLLDLLKLYQLQSIAAPASSELKG